ncbi:unnamed protein product, partial [Pylaiella littoralis]
QGDIFEAKVLETSELPVSSDVAKSLEAVRTPIDEGGWACLFDVVSSVRTLLVHHQEVFQEQEREEVPRLLGVVVPLVATAVSHRRSVVQTNGLRCL